MAPSNIDKQKLAELQAFISLLESSPDTLYVPELDFFRSFMQKYGAKLPESTPSNNEEDDDININQTEPQETGEVVSEDELDSDNGDEDLNADVVDLELMQPEVDDLPPLCTNQDVELTEEQSDRLSTLKQQVADSIEDAKFEEALAKVNEAISIGNPSALTYCKRADLLLKLKRPVACIRDCDEALKLNPDNGKAYRLRGKAHRYLGNWEDAHRDIETGQKIDYDESLDCIQKFVADKWKSIDSKRRASQRRREDRVRRNRMRQRRRQQAAARKAYSETKEPEPHNRFNGGFQGNFSGANGQGGAGLGGLGNLLGGLMNNPEMKKAMENPKVLNAVVELMQNPAAFTKYQNDPEVMSAFTNLMGTMQGSPNI